MNDLPRASGVYLLKHRSTGDTYVGSAASIRDRVSTHLSCLRAGDSPHRALQDLVNIHGIEFAVTVLELTDDRRAAEARFVRDLRPTLNMKKPREGAATPASRARKTLTIAAKVHPRLLAALQFLADADDRTLSYMAEKAIREFVERHAPPDADPPKKPRR